MNFGSKLNRVKQQADRLFLRGDRTDVVGELRFAEEQAEDLRILCEAFSRSLERRLNTHMVTEEKKHRKIPENHSAESLKDALKEVTQTQFDDPHEKPLFKTIIEETIAAEFLLGKEVLDHEELVESLVLVPFHKLLKEEFPSIAKHKKALKQAGQDVDSAKSKVRSSSAGTSQPNKLENYKEELDESEIRLEQIKDAYACDLFTVLSKQKEVARLATLYLELKADHLEKSMQRLNTLLPSIRRVFTESSCSPVYGISLHEHLRITQQEIAVPIQICVKRMIEYGMYEEGLLRMAGSNTKIKRLKGLFDAGLLTLDMSLEGFNHSYDVHVVAGAFKGYLRELPEPLMTHTKHDEFINAVRIPDHEEKLRHIWQVVSTLPMQNYNHLRYVVKFLAMLASYSGENKMTTNNIAIVMAPNLIGSRVVQENEMQAIDRNMTLGNDYRVLVEYLIEYADYFFKSELDFGVLPRMPEPPASPRLALANSNGGSTGRSVGHRRTGSSDLNLSSGHIEVESPKQPHRMKKKPAPLPPQGKNIDDVSGGFGVGPNLTTHGSSHEIPLSKSPPAGNFLPNPAPRLHHTNSLKRPTVGPPKPPATPVSPANKPPRPSPPTFSVDNCDSRDVKHSSSTESSNDELDPKVAPGIGFETIEVCPDAAALYPKLDTLHCSSEPPMSTDEKSEHNSISPGVVSETRDKLDKNVSSTRDDQLNPDQNLQVEVRNGSKGLSDPEFRKSLEGVLKKQPQSRHLVRNSYSGTGDSSSGTDEPKPDERNPAQVPVFPVPSVRSIDKLESQLPTKFEKPALPEKPLAITRSVASSDLSRSVGGHERPIGVNSAMASKEISRSSEVLSGQPEIKNDELSTSIDAKMEKKITKL